MTMGETIKLLDFSYFMHLDPLVTCLAIFWGVGGVSGVCLRQVIG